MSNITNDDNSKIEIRDPNKLRNNSYSLIIYDIYD